MPGQVITKKHNAAAQRPPGSLAGNLTGNLAAASQGISPAGGDPVSAVMGKGRTAILRSTGQPKTTTDLARELHLTGATISVHLTTLKRCGMVTSWRAGQRVFYQRTPLAASILTAASNAHTER